MMIHLIECRVFVINLIDRWRCVRLNVERSANKYYEPTTRQYLMLADEIDKMMIKKILEISNRTTMNESQLMGSKSGSTLDGSEHCDVFPEICLRFSEINRSSLLAFGSYLLTSLASPINPPGFRFGTDCSIHIIKMPLAPKWCHMLSYSFYRPFSSSIGGECWNEISIIHFENIAHLQKISGLRDCQPS